MKVLSSNKKKFETEFSKQHNNMYSVAVSNGSVALDLVLNSLDLKKGDEVITPAVSFIATAVHLPIDEKPLATVDKTI